MALLLGLSIAIGAVMADVYFHRGIETGDEVPTVVQATGRELAVNVDLTVFPREQLEAVAATLQSQGFLYVRQAVEWRSVELERGRFIWDRYDPIVDALTNHGLKPVLVLHTSPDWARAPDAVGQPDAPPRDPSTYATFVSEVVTRYSSNVEFVQLWDLPNRAERWGGISALAGDYIGLLAEGSNAARTANPEAKVLLAELDPAPDNQSFGADLQFLRALYNLEGASAFFDVVAIRLDGGTATPYDRTVDRTHDNFSRAILFRQLMLEAGDDGKSVWATSYGWNAGGETTELSTGDQADFMVAGHRRARAEWPWMGPLFAWDYLPTEGEPGYALVTREGGATEALIALEEYAASGAVGVAGTGYVPMDSRPVAYEGTWSDQHLDRRTFQFTAEVGATATLSFRGTGVIAILRESPQAGLVHVTIDGKPLEGWPGTKTASEIDLFWTQATDVPVVLATGLDDGVHQLSITLAEPGQLTIGGLIVTRKVPFMWPVVVLVCAGALLVVFALRELAYVTAIRAGYLQRREGIELRPPLPTLPDWRPMRRA
ncbi:MAG: hypothetical protein ACRDJW_04695 [Thermomicrobiales bacterium]